MCRPFRSIPFSSPGRAHRASAQRVGRDRPVKRASNALIARRGVGFAQCHGHLVGVVDGDLLVDRDTPK